MQTTTHKPYTKIIVDGRGWVTFVNPNWKPKDPTPYQPNEAQFGNVPLSPRQAPERLPAGYRLTTMQGDPPKPVLVPWKYCKVVNREVIELTAAEKATKDAEIAADKQAEIDEHRTSTENENIYKIMFKMVNAKRPANLQLTPAEARAIVDSVIK